MTKSHTQERLVVANDGTVGSIETESGTPIGHTFQVKPMKEDLLQIERRENARRFVACWNACYGIETEALEGHVLQVIAAERAALAQEPAQKAVQEPTYYQDRLKDWTCRKVENAGGTPGLTLYYTKLGARPEMQLYIDEVLALWTNIGKAVGEFKSVAQESAQPDEPNPELCIHALSANDDMDLLCCKGAKRVMCTGPCADFVNAFDEAEASAAPQPAAKEPTSITAILRWDGKTVISRDVAVKNGDTVTMDIEADFNPARVALTNAQVALGQAILQLQTILNQRLNATQMLEAESEARDWLVSIGSEPT